MSQKIATRKCTMCGKLARCLVEEDDINGSFDHDTGIFQTCLFDSSWELCKNIQEADDANTFVYYKNGECVGKFRELN
jgi:hypothetical protein